LRATADFQAAAMRVSPLGACPPSPDWEAAVERSRELARTGGVPDGHRWVEALKRVHRQMPVLRSRWASRPINAWCHGDVHPANALRRALPADCSDAALLGRHGCVLIDLAMVHCGHWVEDAAYLERQFWGYREILGAVRPVSMLARLRRERGLPADDNYGDLTMVRRVLMAACAPALMEREGSPKHLAAALEIIDRHLVQASK
jgi:hypothetical protein